MLLLLRLVLLLQQQQRDILMLPSLCLSLALSRVMTVFMPALGYPNSPTITPVFRGQCAQGLQSNRSSHYWSQGGSFTESKRSRLQIGMDLAQDEAEEKKTKDGHQDCSDLPPLKNVMWQVA